MTTKVVHTITLRPGAPSPEEAILVDGEPFPFHVSGEVPIRVEALNSRVAVVYLPVLVERVETLTEWVNG